MRLIFLLLILSCAHVTTAQQKNAIVNGLIIDENGNPLSHVSIVILGKNNGIQSDSDGKFSLTVPSEKPLALIFSYTGFNSIQKNFFLSPGESEKLTITMKRLEKTMEAVVVSDDRERKENGLVKINPKNALVIPGVAGGVESLIKTLVGSNNELTSQYEVRGGSYDENLIYINDFEIFRPYLVSNSQQEGLSFINPELVKNLNFYSGGFQARYGDKMSSVLDIQYKKTKQLEGSAYVSLLEQGLSLSGSLKNEKATYVIGIRNKSNKNLLSNQPTVGSYIPSAADLQTLFTYKISEKLQLELLGILSSSKFTFYPESVKKTSSVFSPFYTANLGLDIYFEGQEKDNYLTSLIGATIVHSPSKKMKLKWMLSRFTDSEKENYDITGAYLFGDRDFDNNSSTFGEIINPLGAGIYQQYARNSLEIEVWNAAHRGTYDAGKHFIQWGNSIENTNINDQLRQFEYRDSAGYSLPYQTGSLPVYYHLNNSNQLSVQKYSGYIQDNIHLSKSKNDITLQAGIRYNFNSLNKEFFASPRFQLSWKPEWKNDIVFRLATGSYNQPPFYREMRGTDGSLNTEIKSQKSIQIVGGMDYQFTGYNNRPFRLTSEIYYKSMSNVIPYDIDNVKLTYLTDKTAKAYATGIELRLFSELVKDAESWISVGFMKTREDIANDYYYDYLNAQGQIINASTEDKIIVDSIKNDIGYLRRPTDRLITLGVFLQDYLSTNKNFKVHLSLLYGSNMPYNIPNSTRYRNALVVDPYIRADIGFSALLLSEKNERRIHNPFRNIDNIWLSFEVFNLINKANTISYQLIKDFENNTYAIPNKLTPRLLNLKLIARF